MTRDSWIGLVVLAIAALFWVGADGIRVSPLDDPIGASGLPKTLAYCLGGLAILLILHSLAAKWMLARKPTAAAPAAADKEGEEPGPGSRSRHLRALGMLALGVGYLLVVPYLGYALTISALLLAVSLYVGARFGPRALVFAGAGGAFFYVLFVQFLNIPLPPGIWPEVVRAVQG